MNLRKIIREEIETVSNDIPKCTFRVSVRDDVWKDNIQSIEEAVKYATNYVFPEMVNRMKERLDKEQMSCLRRIPFPIFDKGHLVIYTYYKVDESPDSNYNRSVEISVDDLNERDISEEFKREAYTIGQAKYEQGKSWKFGSLENYIDRVGNYFLKCDIYQLLFKKLREKYKNLF